MDPLEDQVCADCSLEQIEICIERAILSPGAKRVLREAFTNGTSTPAMVQQLRQYCEYLADDTPAARRQGMLSRLRPASGARQSAPSAESSVAPAPEAREDPTLVIDAREMQAYIAEVMASRSPGETLAEALVHQEMPPVSAPGRLLRVLATNHRIALPDNGRITLGSLDPFSRIFPDVDVSHDDREFRSVALVHAGITGQAGEHVVEDFGSLNGTWLHGQRLTARIAYRLELGDRLALGQCELVYEAAPASWTAFGKTYVLYATPTGNVFELPQKEELIIGRADPRLGFVPDVDLSQEGDTAALVSRRHVALRYHGGTIEVADLGSTNKTRIDGVPLPPGVWAPLRPGQHLWLGGFGLALDTPA